jgi:hypothetical protein
MGFMVVLFFAGGFLRPGHLRLEMEAAFWRAKLISQEEYFKCA